MRCMRKALFKEAPSFIAQAVGKWGYHLVNKEKYSVGYRGKLEFHFAYIKFKKLLVTEVNMLNR